MRSQLSTNTVAQNPAMKLLRNRAALESSTDDDGNSVRPGTFVSIVEDLQHYTAVEVQKRYSLSDEFMEALRVVNMSVAKERIVSYCCLLLLAVYIYEWC